MALAKNPYWLKSGFYSIAQNALILVFNFGSFFILVRLVSVEDFGAWNLFLAIISVMEVFRYGLLRNSLIKFIASNKQELHGEINTASLLLNSLTTFLGFFILIGFSTKLSELWGVDGLARMFWIHGLTAVFLVLFTQFDYLHHAHLNFKAVFWPNIARKGIFFFFVAFAYFLNIQVDLIQLVWFQAVATFLAALISYFMIKDYLILSAKVSMIWIKKQFDYGKYVLGTNLSSMLYKSIDQFMLGALMSTEAVAKYSIAVRVTNLVEVPTTAISTIVFPQSVKRLQSDGEASVKYLYEKSVGVILALMVPAALFILLFPGFVIWIVAGDKYSDTAAMLQVTILYTLFVPFARQFGSILDSMGLPKINFYFTGLSMLLNVISNYFFIKHFGMIGAAYGTLITYFISFIVMQIVITKRLNVNTFNTLRYMFEFYKSIFNTLIVRLSKNR